MSRFTQGVDNHKQTPISLYCHIPFCETVCYFCGCNTISTQRKEVAVPYLDYVARHIDLVAPLVSQKRLVQQMHWGVERRIICRSSK